MKILINDSVIKALENYFEQEKFPDPNDYLFKTQTGQRLDRIRAWALIKKWIEAVGLDPASYGTHTLRKTWGTVQTLSQRDTLALSRRRSTT